MKHTSLYQAHLAAAGKMVDFSGWEMPLHYGSQIQEHHKVRADAGMFDVSHMRAVDISGTDAKAFLRLLLANDVAKLQTKGKALYSCMLNHSGCVLDDLIVYYQAADNYRLVINAGATLSNIKWMKTEAKPFNVSLLPLNLAIIAVQGPNARTKVFDAMPGVKDIAGKLSAFNSVSLGGLLIARTGYTGEDGFEIMLSEKSAVFTWNRLQEAGVSPCGLGARATLRLEAGMSLYGQEMDDKTSPLEASLGWSVDLGDENRNFIGRKPLVALKNQGVKKTITGLVLEGKGILRNQQTVRTTLGEGKITSGSFSPTMNKAIALASVPKGSVGSCEIQIRDKWVSAKIVSPPFVRNGKILV